MALGKHQLRLLRFALDYPGWHDCGPDARRTMASLENLGLLEVVRYNNRLNPQFRIRQPRFTTAVDNSANNS